jgi:hypothetical protein
MFVPAAAVKVAETLFVPPGDQSGKQLFGPISRRAGRAASSA